MKELLIKLLGYNHCYKCGIITTQGKYVYTCSAASRRDRKKIEFDKFWFCESCAPAYDLAIESWHSPRAAFKRKEKICSNNTRTYLKQVDL